MRMSFSLVDLEAPVGAEVRGLVVSALADDDEQRLRRALADHGVLVARGLNLAPAEHVALTRVFGEPEIHPIESIRLRGVPEIIELAVDLTAHLDPADPAADEQIGEVSWHSDLTYTAEPSRGSLLSGIEVPPEGGETGFVDMAGVYAALPEVTRRRLRGLEAIHSFGEPPDAAEGDAVWIQPVAGADVEFPPVVHPLVHRHPVVGTPVLDLSPTFVRGIVGWSRADSDELLDELGEFAMSSRFTYFHQWAAGDLLIWDNWRTMHTATGHKKRYRRRMFRTTVHGGASLEPAALIDGPPGSDRREWA
jgi:taurine dioxygenase